MKYTVRTLIAMVLVVMLCLIGTVSAGAAPYSHDISTNSLYLRASETVNGAVEYSIDEQASWMEYAGDVTITGRTSDFFVTVLSGAHSIILDDVSITGVESPFSIEGASSVNLTLDGDNELEATNDAGLALASGATLNIDADNTSGQLRATGSMGSAGIGGGRNENGGTVNIMGGSVTAEWGAAVSGSQGAGIGGGAGATNHGKITISGSPFVRVSSFGVEPTAMAGLIFVGDEGMVYSDHVISSDLVMSTGESLTVPEGVTLTTGVGVSLEVPTGASLYVYSDSSLTGSGSGVSLRGSGDFFILPSATNVSILEQGLSNGTVSVDWDKDIVTTQSSLFGQLFEVDPEHFNENNYTISFANMGVGVDVRATFTPKSGVVGEEFTVLFTVTTGEADDRVIDYTLNYDDGSSKRVYLADYIPTGAGAVSYTKRTAYIDGEGTVFWEVDDDGRLTFEISDGEADDVYELPVEIESENYEPFLITLEVTLIQPSADISPSIYVSSKTARVSVSTLQIAEAITAAERENEPITISMNLSGSVEKLEVTLTDDALYDFADSDVDELYIESNLGTLILTRDTAEEIAYIAHDDKIIFVLAEVDHDDLNTSESYLADGRPVYDVYIESDDEYIFDLSRNDLIIVLPYELERYENGNDLVIQEMNSRGEIESEYDANYDDRDETVTFETDYLGKFIIGNETIISSYNRFDDVTYYDWYYDEVMYMYENDFMEGVDTYLFGPNNYMTRAMLVTVLWRMEGEPYARESSFTDVEHSAWYGEAVAWAEDEGIVEGMNEWEFIPHWEVTRQELMVIIYRYEQSKGGGYRGSWRDDLDNYTDRAQVADWAYEAACWLTSEDIVEGSGSKLLPLGFATRAEVSAIIMRYHEDHG